MTYEHVDKLCADGQRRVKSLFRVLGNPPDSRPPEVPPCLISDSVYNPPPEEELSGGDHASRKQANQGSACQCLAAAALPDQAQRLTGPNAEAAVRYERLIASVRDRQVFHFKNHFVQCRSPIQLVMSAKLFSAQLEGKRRTQHHDSGKDADPRSDLHVIFSVQQHDAPLR